MERTDTLQRQIAGSAPEVQTYIGSLERENALLKEELNKRDEWIRNVARYMIAAQNHALQLEKQLISTENEKVALQQEIADLKQALFGPSSEKDVYLLTGEPKPDDSDESPPNDDNVIDIHAHQRRKASRKQHGVSNCLPVQRVVTVIPCKDVYCKGCGGLLEMGGYYIKRTWAYIPGHYEERIEKYEKKVCAKQACNLTFIIAPRPLRLFQKSPYAPSLLASIIVEKCFTRTPMYHQEKLSFYRYGNKIPLTRQTMSRLFVRTAQELQPLYNLFSDQLSEYDIGWMDATTLQVLKEEDRKPQTKSKIWNFIGGPEGEKAVIYRYRAKDHKTLLEEMWSGFQGTLHCDADPLYKSLFRQSGICANYCNAHARRPFAKIAKRVKAAGISHHVISVYKKIYQVEDELKAIVDPEKRRIIRQKKVLPEMEALLAYMKKHIDRVPPKTPLGKGMNYFLNHYDGLICFTKDGRLHPDNNYCEQIGIGRNLTAPPSHTTRHTGPYHGGSTQFTIQSTPFLN